METIPLRPREQMAPQRVLVIGESRRSSPSPCSTCGARRKTWLRSVGWVCTACFDQCKETADRFIEVGSGAARMRHAYARAIVAYQAAHPAPDTPPPSGGR
jgi:hypothetical protein